MKKITLLLLLLILPGFMVGQNLIQDGTFSIQTGLIPTAADYPNNIFWFGNGFGGTKTQILTDNITDSEVGQLGNDSATLRQDFTVTPEVTYQISFDYRWVTSSSGVFITVRQLPVNTVIITLPALNATADVWHKVTATFTVPIGVTSARLQLFHSTGSALRIDNVSVRKLYTFDGSTDSNFATATNWDLNEAPTDDDVIIPTGQNVVLNGGATVGNVTINGTGTLTLNAGSSLVVATGNNVIGNITYNRTLQGGKWHLIAPPVVGATYNDTWIADNGIASGTGNNRGIGIYQNGTLDIDTDGAGSDTATGPWNYVQAGASGTFETSKGYSLRRTSTGTVSFTGTYPTGARPFAATIGSGSAFNLVGNPYPTYLSAANFFTNNPFTNDVEEPLTDKLSESTIWIWDQSANGGLGDYVQKTSGIDGAFQIAPGQAFFISSGTATNKDIIFFQYNGTNQSDTFLKSTKTQVNLLIKGNGVNASTELYYLPEGTNDFDNGYDASMFTGVTSNFSLYTSQLSNGSKKLARQVLSDENVETLVVPVGIKAAAGQEITFSAEAMNLPEGIKVFLEDRENNTITRLDEANSEYKVTLTEALDGTGRFFLHTKSSAVLGTEEVNLSNVSIFKTSNENLRIVGLSQGTASLKMYNITGKQVLNTNFQSKGANDIALPKLATGVYIVQLQTENGRTNKKIILE